MAAGNSPLKGQRYSPSSRSMYASGGLSNRVWNTVNSSTIKVRLGLLGVMLVIGFLQGAWVYSFMEEKTGAILGVQGSHRKLCGRPVSSTAKTPLRVAILSTYPPQLCGIGEFSYDVYKGYQKNNLVGTTLPVDAGVLVLDEPGTPLRYSDEVKMVIRKDFLEDYIEAAKFINENFDILNVQHEFGIAGGQYGDFLFALVSRVNVPIHYNFHTVLRTPPAWYAEHFKQVLDNSALVSVILPSLCNDIARISPKAKCVHIPHGVPDLVHPKVQIPHQALLAGRKVLLSIGLIGPGKGFEYMIDAMAAVSQAAPEALYLIVGGQHPGYQGNYLDILKQAVSEKGLNNSVAFISKSLEKWELIEWMAVPDVVVVPHLEPEQISSGTLTMAMGLGKPAITTAFRYANHMCDGTSGAVPGVGATLPGEKLPDPGTVRPCVTVPFADAKALAAAALDLLREPRLLSAMGAVGYAHTRSMTWDSVARKSADFYMQLLEPSASPEVDRHHAASPANGSSSLHDSSPEFKPWDYSSSTQKSLASALTTLAAVDPSHTALSTADLAHSLGRTVAWRSAPLRARDTADLITQHLSIHRLVLAGWRPAEKMHVDVMADGTVYVSNGLLAIHGELRNGRIQHSALADGLVFGRGVLYAYSVTFKIMDKYFEARFADKVIAWGHEVNEDRSVSLWCTAPLDMDGVSAGNLTGRWTVMPGSMRLGVEMEALFEPEYADKVEVLEFGLAADYLSGLFKDVHFDKFLFYSEKGNAHSAEVVGADGLLFDSERDERPIWTLIANSHGPNPLFTSMPNAPMLRYISYNGASDGRLHFLSNRYVVERPDPSRPTRVRERKLLLSNAQLDRLDDYDRMLTAENFDQRFAGFDLSTPADIEDVLRGVSVYVHHVADKGEWASLDKWLKDRHKII